MRTHEWSEDVLARLRDAPDAGAGAA
jgi:hypothetical protein